MGLLHKTHIYIYIYIYIYIWRRDINFRSARQCKKKSYGRKKIGPCARVVADLFAVGLGVAPDMAASAPVGGRFRCHPRLRKKKWRALPLGLLRNGAGHTRCQKVVESIGFSYFLGADGRLA